MNLRDFSEGIKILSRYYDDPDGYHIGAEVECEDESEHKATD